MTLCFVKSAEIKRMRRERGGEGQRGGENTRKGNSTERERERRRMRVETKSKIAKTKEKDSEDERKVKKTKVEGWRVSMLQRGAQSVTDKALIFSSPTHC